MLRIYLLQLWFNLSDPAVEEALYDSAAMRNFTRIDLGRKVRYRGLAKNLHRMQVTCALANLFMVRRRLLTG
jgi:IS5 family transposase